MNNERAQTANFVENDGLCECHMVKMRLRAFPLHSIKKQDKI